MIAILLAAACTCASVCAQTITVCLDGSCDHTSIQAAIDAATTGDVIEVSGETYLLDATIDTNGKAVTIQGTVDPVTENPLTILDGSTLDTGSMIRIDNSNSIAMTEGQDAVLRGLILINGSGGTPLSEGSSNLAGAALYIKSSSPTIEQCVFSDHTADYGGAAYITEGAPSIRSCTFSGNIAEWGAGVYTRDSSSVVLNGCVFDNNVAGSRGGAMYYHLETSATLTNCTFTNNSSDQGGGIYTSSFGTFSLAECTFTSNSATQGGGLYNKGDTNLNLCTFSNNSSQQEGGGAFVSGSANPSGISGTCALTSCVFEDNAAQSGGAIQIGETFNQPSSVTIQSCSFTDNTTTSRGGAINATGGNTSLNPVITISDSSFTGNNSPNYNSVGGAFSSEPADVHFQRCLFTQNRADSGGAVYAENGQFDDCTFTDNTAFGSGDVFVGGVGGALAVGGCFSCFGDFTRCTGCVFTGNTAGGDGGGLFNGTANQCLLTNCVFESNTAPNGFGGGLAGYVSYDYIITDCSFKGNIAKRGGGMHAFALFSTETDLTSRISNTSFTGNTAELEGGGLFIQDGGIYCCAYGINHVLNGCTFAGNRLASGESGSGSAIFWENSYSSSYDGTLTIGDTTVCENQPTSSQIAGGTWIDGDGNCIAEACTTCAGCLGDLDGDGEVGAVDLGFLLGYWGCSGSGCIGDLDGSGTVDGADLTIILSAWGGCS